MNWQIEQRGNVTIVALGHDMGIRDAADFHQAVLAVANLRGAVQVNAREAKSVHSSIMQILFALSEAVPGFTVEEASNDFLAAEARVGFSLGRSKEIKTPAELVARE